ncbi:hypothetical protein SAMN05661012_05380 [Chitinophaga sancti]|uniref:Uncharacterized protein n=1 Tax=Chitinophaga sancti TaxID=1004 RepID=A0A1K1SFX9_9BACT|nr:hypothetical protein SAMN05661012_05380 [Chitinophaga sancti]
MPPFNIVAFNSSILSTYAPALQLFRSAQAEKQMHEPIATYLDCHNKLHGTIIVIRDQKNNITVEMALAILQDEMNTLLQKGKIQSSAIFYHSCFTGQPGDTPTSANNATFVAHEDYNAISLLYATQQGQTGTIICPYIIKDNIIRHQPIHGFDSASPFDAEAAEKEITFDEPIEYTDFEIRNEYEIGIRNIEKPDQIYNMEWEGFIGAKNFALPAIKSILNKAISATKNATITYINGKIGVSSLDLGPITIVGIHVGKSFYAYPAMRPSHTFEVTTDYIEETFQRRGTEALIAASINNKILINFLATDYLKHHSTYRSVKTNWMKIGALALFIDVRPVFEDNTFWPEDNYGDCGLHQFMGTIINIKTVAVLDVKAYVITTNIGFELDIFVSAENVMDGLLQAGGHIRGVICFHGEIIFG